MLQKLQSHPLIQFAFAYTTAANVMQRPLFTPEEGAHLHPEAAKKLYKAADIAGQQGYALKIFDAYRPLAAQQALFQAFPEGEFISNPETGACPHVRGVAVDLTLLDVTTQQEIPMGTEFDDFTPAAWHGDSSIAVEAQRNRSILLGIMTMAGWDFYSKEWWHYQLFQPRKYPFIEKIA